MSSGEIASQVRSLAKRRRVSSNRVLVELIELADKFRNTTDTEEGV